MLGKVRFRQLLVSFLALWYDVSQKVIASRTGLSESTVSNYLRRREMSDEVFGGVLGVVLKRPAAEWIVAGCLESLDALDHAEGLTEEELAAVEMEAHEAARLTREILTEAFRRSRAGEAGGRRELSSAAPRLLAEVTGLCLDLCEESRQAASREAGAAEVLARVAAGVAARLPEADSQWLRGYAAAHEAVFTAS